MTPSYMDDSSHKKLTPRRLSVPVDSINSGAVAELLSDGIKSRKLIKIEVGGKYQYLPMPLVYSLLDAANALKSGKRT